MGTSNYPQGSKQNPYSIYTYQYLINNNIWRGGWVNEANSLVYVTSQNKGYTMERALLGTEKAPYPYTVYQEMVANRNWTGGWVMTPNQMIVYEESLFFSNDSSSSAGSNLGSESGCGSGSGSGSGCGFDSGCGTGSESDSSCGSSEDLIAEIYSGSFSSVVFDNEHCIAFKVRFSWTSGKFNLTTKDCSSTFTVDVYEVAQYGDCRITDYVRGYAHWKSPVVFDYTIKFRYYKISSPSNICDATLSNPMLRDDLGC